jgi:Na+/phosphate symporter
MEMLYLINKEDMDHLLNLEVNEAKIDMMGEEGIRTYVFKLHKEALKEQLACFLQEEDRKKK